MLYELNNLLNNDVTWFFDKNIKNHVFANKMTVSSMCGKPMFLVKTNALTNPKYNIYIIEVTLPLVRYSSIQHVHSNIYNMYIAEVIPP